MWREKEAWCQRSKPPLLKIEISFPVIILSTVYSIFTKLTQMMPLRNRRNSIDFSYLNMHHHLLQIIKSIILNFFCNLASAPVVPRFILLDFYFQNVVIVFLRFYIKHQRFVSSHNITHVVWQSVETQCKSWYIIIKSIVKQCGLTKIWYGLGQSLRMSLTGNNE